MNKLDIQPWTYPHDVELYLLTARDSTPAPSFTCGADGAGLLRRAWSTAPTARAVGCGLWMWTEKHAEWRQIRGTCQFSLLQDRQKAIQALAK